MALAHGFADPVLDAQRAFRAVMDALARPGTLQRLGTDLEPPAPLTPELGAIALMLADHEAPVWLDAPLAEAPEVAAFLRFHTGAAIVSDAAQAALALVADPAGCPPFEAFALGTPDYPDRSATIAFAVAQLSDCAGFWLEGPGIRDRARLSASPLPPDMGDRLRRNHALFPRGVDCLFAGRGRVAGLPRSITLLEDA